MIYVPWISRIAARWQTMMMRLGEQEGLLRDVHRPAALATSWRSNSQHVAGMPFF
jgi:hypothetical protein